MTRIVHIAMVTCMLATMGIASAQSTHDGFGATVYQDDGGWGTSFRTWTPNADAVYVTGSFNGWGTNTHQLVAEDGDYWSLDVPGVWAGHEYQFIVLNDGNTHWRNDPRARAR